MDHSFEEILDICLERIINKGDSVESCLESYPEYAERLEPLLRASIAVHDISSIQPGREFQQAARSRFLSAVAENKGNRGKFFPAGWQQRWAVALAAVLIVVMAGGGVVIASSDSLPGETLYSVKTASEKVQSFFTFGDEAKARLHIKFAERRIEEIEALAEKNRDVSTSVLEKMHEETDRAIELLTDKKIEADDISSDLLDLTSNQKAALKRILENASPELQSKLVDSIQRTEVAHNSVLQIQQAVPETEDTTEPDEHDGEVDGIKPQETPSWEPVMPTVTPSPSPSPVVVTPDRPVITPVYTPAPTSTPVRTDIPKPSVTPAIDDSYDNSDSTDTFPVTPDSAVTPEVKPTPYIPEISDDGMKSVTP